MNGMFRARDSRHRETRARERLVHPCSSVDQGFSFPPATDVTIKVALHHKTRYEYDRPVSLSPHEVRLRPAAHTRTPIESYSFKVKPTAHFLNWQQDPYGNWPDDRRARAARLRPRGHLEWSLARRLHV